MAAIQQ